MDYELNITITRHGPKYGFAGPLTEAGKKIIEDHFTSYQQNFLIDPNTPRQLVSSPIDRARETALIFEQVMRKERHLPPASLEIDDRLSENNLSDFRDTLPEDLKADWFRYWYSATERPRDNIAIGKEGLRKFTQWILEKLRDQRRSGGALRIDAFSHGPLMAGFILKMEELTAKEILVASGQGQDKLDFDKLFGSQESEFGYLGRLNIFASSPHDGDIILRVGGKTVIIPENILLILNDDKVPG